MIAYVDTSALIKCYLEESESSAVREVIHQAQYILSSALTELEMISAIERAKHHRRINSPSYRTILSSFEKDLNKEVLSLIEMTPLLLKEAKRIIRHHRLRPPDAIQLAASLHAKRAFATSIEFLCFDEALLAAAKLEGLKCCF